VVFEEYPFTGDVRHTVDDKGRIAIPARYRELFVDGVFVGRGMDTCLTVHTREGWAEIIARIAGLPMTSPAARMLERRLFGGATELKLDTQGRVLLPENLRQFAGITDAARVIGVGKRLEIWEPGRWENNLEAFEDDTTFAATVSDLGV
jgi:MraZ protein